MEGFTMEKEYRYDKYERRQAWRKKTNTKKEKPQNSRSKFEGRIASEVSIQKDFHGSQDTYVVTIDDEDIITTTLTNSESEIREWVRQIRAISNKQNCLLVGLSATSMEHYKYSRLWHPRLKEKREEPRYNLLQLCVGTHCLIVSGWKEYFIPRVLRDFFYDDRTFFCGVGIEDIATKLEKENDGLIITNRLELRTVAARKYFPGNKFEKCSVEELARLVFEDQVDIVMPKVIYGYDSYQSSEYSMEMIKYATVEAFLACQMAQKLYWDC